MGIFNKKEKPEWINISGEQLCKVLELAIDETKHSIEEKGFFIFCPEVMIDYKNNPHFIGIRYDKKAAKKEGFKNIFSEEFVSVFLDKQIFKTIDEFYLNAVIEGQKLSEIQSDIYIPPEFNDIFN